MRPRQTEGQVVIDLSADVLDDERADQMWVAGSELVGVDAGEQGLRRLGERAALVEVAVQGEEGTPRAAEVEVGQETPVHGHGRA